MGRYDRNRNKKTDNATFGIAILVSLLIGITGTYYVMEKRKQLKYIEITADETSRQAASSEQFPEEQPVVDGGEGESLMPAAPEAEANIGDQDPNKLSDLPDLLGSDDYVRQMLAKLAPALGEWLKTDQLVRRYVVITHDFAQGQRISKHFSFLRFDEPFAVIQDENSVYIAPKSYKRYDNLAQIIQAIDAKAAVVIYQKLRPLMLQVFAEFRYPNDITLENIVQKAAGEIVAAPVLDGQIALVRPSVLYKFADPKLEALNPVQKQMIRMGAANTRIFQAKCREFLVALAKARL
jgi:Protein of unknown function (DUF3014)